LERDVPLAAIERAYAGQAIDAAALVERPPTRAPKTPARQQKSKPRFKIGDRVIDPWGSRGKVKGIAYGLDSKEADVGDVDRWLRGLSIKPKTPRRGIWYTVRPNSGGEVLVGELDLNRVQ